MFLNKLFDSSTLESFVRGEVRKNDRKKNNNEKFIVSGVKECFVVFRKAKV